MVPRKIMLLGDIGVGKSSIARRFVFDAFEAIAAEHEGRPHWGKLHTLGADRLGELYPRFDDFRTVRDRLDPDRLFTNDYLRKVLGS